MCCPQAIDLMDEAGSRIGLRRPEFPASVQAIVDQLVALQMEKRDAVREQDYLRASEMQSQILSLQDSFNKQIAERKAEREELRRGSKIAESIKNDLPALKQELIEVTPPDTHPAICVSCQLSTRLITPHPPIMTPYQLSSACSARCIPHPHLFSTLHPTSTPLQHAATFL